MVTWRVPWPQTDFGMVYGISNSRSVSVNLECWGVDGTYPPPHPPVQLIPRKVRQFFFIFFQPLFTFLYGVMPVTSWPNWSHHPLIAYAKSKWVMQRNLFRITERTSACWLQITMNNSRGSEWYLQKRGSRKILSGSRNLGSVYDKSRSLVFWWFVFTFLSLETFYQRVSGSDF